MANERDRLATDNDQLSTGEMDHLRSPDALHGEPKQVAQVNMLPDEPLDFEDETSSDAPDLTGHPADAPTADPGALGGWGPMAWLLGLLALAMSIGVLMFILSGVFQSMPS